MSLALTLSSKGRARVSRLAVPPSQIWYELGPSPTKPSSAMYGRAHPLGHPVMRISTASSGARPTLFMVARRRLLMSGRPRSASVMARPHRGRAGHAMDRASRGSTSDTSLTPPAASVAMMSAFHAGSISVSSRSCCAVSRTGSSYRSITARSAFLASPRTRPLTTCTPYHSLPSPCSCQPRYVGISHAGSSAMGRNFLPMYCSLTALNLSMPQESIRYLSRACLRSSRRP
mmetsp:Transcript_19102/g.47650  ORF Transcript_19102/g.47650 Transcript_19102/m.47650 type:complete len:231 (-) Transcript_19102:1132-1824(-)